ncbi:endonuclease/exonuclease/phosphatase family protein [Paenibacillus sp. KQZ6P-2]|uniref:Endonuclease/exonuclease/phosphatase family protein n=1 Tax=Paenibacillus mangrovi TaxID=2931978 RepID=A0A9X2B3R6_9BACL|nr:endonuclease/exonuclease/phosphatase family protein [Paenibacillus mangrovi]MCJ8010278.1 endonuclease/exonuclease/phosphatase family protein [Paenibacillus mangrovi]
MEMTVMSFNLRYNNPGDGANQWMYRADRAAQMIKDHHPLVIGTQEGYYDMLTDLQERLDDYAWAGTGRMGGHENEHCAIFYRKEVLALLEQGTFWLSETPDVPGSKSWDSDLPRICTWARFEHRQIGEKLTVFNIHLDHLGQEARNQGTRMIWESIASSYEKHPTPTILTGDFNSHPSELPIALLRGNIELDGQRSWLKDAYTAMSSEIGSTRHDFNGGEQGEPIDYIFVSPEWNVRSIQVDRHLMDGAYPSDHYPVIAKLHCEGSTNI